MTASPPGPDPAHSATPSPASPPASSPARAPSHRRRAPVAGRREARRPVPRGGCLSSVAADLHRPPHAGRLHRLVRPLPGLGRIDHRGHGRGAARGRDHGLRRRAGNGPEPLAMDHRAAGAPRVALGRGHRLPRLPRHARHPRAHPVARRPDRPGPAGSRRGPRRGCGRRVRGRPPHWLGCPAGRRHRRRARAAARDRRDLPRARAPGRRGRGAPPLRHELRRHRRGRLHRLHAVGCRPQPGDDPRAKPRAERLHRRRHCPRDHRDPPRRRPGSRPPGAGSGRRPGPPTSGSGSATATSRSANGRSRATRSRSSSPAPTPRATPQELAADLAAAYGGPVTLDVEYVPTTRQQVEAAP